MFYTYIIKSEKDGGFYVGITTDPQRRASEHNSGKLKSTRNKRPWMLWHVRKSDSMDKARIEELYLKKKNKDFKESLKNT